VLGNLTAVVLLLNLVDDGLNGGDPGMGLGLRLLLLLLLLLLVIVLLLLLLLRDHNAMMPPS
jgi:hypothetical protein